MFKIEEKIKTNINDSAIRVSFNFQPLHRIKHAPVYFHVRVRGRAENDVIFQTMHAIGKTSLLEAEVDTPSDAIGIIL